jgi:hypothetical protein
MCQAELRLRSKGYCRHTWFCAHWWHSPCSSQTSTFFCFPEPSWWVGGRSQEHFFESQKRKVLSISMEEIPDWGIASKKAHCENVQNHFSSITGTVLEKNPGKSLWHRQWQTEAPLLFTDGGYNDLGIFVIPCGDWHCQAPNPTVCLPSPGSEQSLPCLTWISVAPPNYFSWLQPSLHSECDLFNPRL